MPYSLDEPQKSFYIEENRMVPVGLKPIGDEHYPTEVDELLEDFTPTDGC